VKLKPRAASGPTLSAVDQRRVVIAAVVALAGAAVGVYGRGYPLLLGAIFGVACGAFAFVFARSVGEIRAVFRDQRSPRHQDHRGHQHEVDGTTQHNAAREGDQPGREQPAHEGQAQEAGVEHDGKPT
jgi:hypothetical protein